jgi:excinuclease ABC subunit A
MILMFNDDEVVPKGDHPGDGLIEHMRQHDVIKTADWVIDLGPGGGVNGGKIIAEGPPETIAKAAGDGSAGGTSQSKHGSATGQYLKPMLERASVKPKVVEVAPKRVKRSRKVLVDEDEPDLIAAK